MKGKLMGERRKIESVGSSLPLVEISSTVSLDMLCCSSSIMSIR